MRSVSFLFLCTFLIASFSAECFTVILKSGKAYDGSLIADHRDTLQFKGRDGILISFKKSILDIEAMQRKNVQVEVARTTVRPSPQPKPSLVEIAQANKLDRSGHSKMLSDRDIENLPDVSIIGSLDEPPSNYSRTSSELSQTDEKRWRSEAAAWKERLSAAREKNDKVASQCTRARNSVIHQSKRRKGEISILQAMKEPAECSQAAEKAQVLERLEQQWNDFTDRARRAGVPWSWIE